ncbi:MAG TPA: RNA polymerase sigma factor [Puia sp.]
MMTNLNIFDVRRGDDKAWRDVHESFRKDLNRIAIAILQNKEDAEEVVSDALLLAWENRTAYESIFHLENSLRQIVQNRSINQLKKRNRYKAIFPDLDVEFMSGRDSHEMNLHEAIVSEVLWNRLLRQVTQEIPLLTEREQEIFRLHRIEGYSTSDVAAKLGINVQSVRNQDLTARKKIAQSLKAKGYHEVLPLILTLALLFLKLFFIFYVSPQRLVVL